MNIGCVWEDYTAEDWKRTNDLHDLAELGDREAIRKLEELEAIEDDYNDDPFSGPTDDETMSDCDEM